jgi:subtilisin family serine protease
MSLHKLSFVLIGSLLVGSTAIAQSDAYLVQFKDKPATVNAALILSNKSLARRAKFNIPFTTEDQPVYHGYKTAIGQIDSTIVRYALKWHNGLVINASKMAASEIAELTFVAKVSYVGKAETPLNIEKPQFITPVMKLKESTILTDNLLPEDYGMAYTQNRQIQITDLHQNGYNGKGITIAVFDAGFNAIDKIPSFLKHQANGLLTFGFDIAGLDNVLNIKDNHGTAVTSCIGGYHKGKFIGGAPMAHLILFRTEYAATEYPIEELNWCKAAELADSAGVDIISSSLGYNQYDDKSLSYTHKDLDGETSYSSKAARVASQKGIIVLNSAGNSGDNQWRKIGTPSDVAAVLTIGAADKNGKPGNFSSQGYNALGTVKPDIAAMGVLASVASPSGSYYRGYGTSYSTPIAAGGVACLVQAFPKTHPDAIKQAIRTTASQSMTPDSFLGYGIAQLNTAADLLLLKHQGEVLPKIMSTTQNFVNVYTGNTNLIEYQVFQHRKFLLLFNTKKKVAEGKNKSNQGFYRINLSDSPLKCSKRYTIKMNLKSSVDTYELKSSELYNCLN